VGIIPFPCSSTSGLYCSVKNVFVPYLILSTLAFIIFLVYVNRPHEALARKLNDLSDVFISNMEYLVPGRVQLAYWLAPDKL